MFRNGNNNIIILNNFYVFLNCTPKLYETILKYSEYCTIIVTIMNTYNIS